MRYQASEVNRLFFDGWGWTQFPFAAAVLALALRGGLGGAFRAAAALSALIVCFLQLYVVPETIRLGAMMDFGGGDAETAERFWALHHTYTGLDLLKLFLLLGCGAVLVRNANRPEGE